MSGSPLRALQARRRSRAGQPDSAVRSRDSAGAPSRVADFGDAEVNSCAAGGAHGFELLFGGGHGGLDRGDLTHPAVLLGLPESVGEVGVDLLQSRELGRVNPK
jgi:hypothetical protein